MNQSIRFFEPTGDDHISFQYAIIVSRYRNRWIWVRHRQRTTWELPAGHLESGESPMEAARRELFEETGALRFTIEPMSAYEGTYRGQQVFGMIYLANVSELGILPDYEIGEIRLFESIPESLTYPEIQPVFFQFVSRLADKQDDQNIS